MVTLQIIHCKKCNADYLMGIDRKDIGKSKTSGGDFQGTPFMAIGNDEMDKAPEIKSTLDNEIKCRQCGELCKIKECKSTSTKRKVNNQDE